MVIFSFLGVYQSLQHFYFRKTIKKIIHRFNRSQTKNKNSL